MDEMHQALLSFETLNPRLAASLGEYKGEAANWK
jgi:hypothetical protein